MAKKNSSVMSFSDIVGKLQTISKKTAILLETEKKERHYIDTGIYMLNALLSASIKKGGLSDNRITIFAGETGVGKSYLAYNIIRNAQKEGYRCLFIDTEYSVELSDFENFGVNINPDKFLLLRSNKVEDLKLTLTQLLDDLKEKKLKGTDIGKNMIILDSIGQLASIKEVDDALSGKNKVDMSRAKAIKSLFRIINSDLGFLNIPLLATSHIYLSQDLFPVAKLSGGEGLNYSASTIVLLTKAKLKTGEEDEMDLNSSGIVVTAKSRKNRLAKPKKIKFEINHTKGTNPYKGLELFLTPENFEKVGIAKVKKVVDKKTKKITYTTGGTKYYVRHLDKSFYEKQLYTSKIFTDEVLDELDKIIYDYFTYKSYDEILEIEKELDDKYQDFEEDKDFDIDDDADDELFK